ncbi:MAG: D-glycero-beta-D-manno-heptose 1-phosphate adenylyltransferase [Candidatus Muirbacterium halophilum]|nr:D-glycero-beta-D-manno-heptose 1-phosphate adenylyltransferase [Candidatus Muirbacterium halophilum]MCK9474844.1 D-glycero-beta-D-manno-heptose 1-phosphate adenylyltransferase [Candidatus Muirbacterium halophilum]
MEYFEIAEKMEKIRNSGKKIVFTNGCFDILHAGHVDYLRKASDLGDYFVIGLNSDTSVKKLKGKNRPINNEIARKLVLEGIKGVDEVILFDEDTPYELIDAVFPHILVKGGDYTPKNIVGRDIVEKYGGRVEVIPFLEGYSTSDIIAKIRGEI